MYVLAIDQGTTGTTTVLIDEQARIVDKAYREFTQIYPRPGWVEHKPEEIWATVCDTVTELLGKGYSNITAIGITNQRETTIVWDRRTGKPVCNAIVWQCRRTADLCRKLSMHEPVIRQKTGLTLDAYFSGTKLRWILDNIPDHDAEYLAFGTVDTWLIWNLTGGRVHATDYTNASRTLLFNIETKQWDEELLDIFTIPRTILPQVKSSIDNYGAVTSIKPLEGTPIFAVAGDQQAALFGQTCFNPGEVKNTYGTGCFAVMNTGSKLVRSHRGLMTTLAVDSRGNPCYALEGSIFIAGAAIQWLRDELRILESASQSEGMAVSVGDNDGVYLVPAFTGLGAPHWNMQARGAIVGLTRGSNRNHIVRAALEAMAYQTNDVILLMEEETGLPINTLMVDGGAVVNNFLMQFQADILNRPVHRPYVIESTSLGAGLMAGLKAGIWSCSDSIRKLRSIERIFVPDMDPSRRDKLITGWQSALKSVI